MNDQNYTHLTVNACEALQHNVIDFLQGFQEVSEESKDDYPCLCELKQKAHALALQMDTLSQMPPSPQQLMMALKTTQGRTGTPFGRLPTAKQFDQIPIVFMRTLLCLELGDVRYADGPS